MEALSPYQAGEGIELSWSGGSTRTLPASGDLPQQPDALPQFKDSIFLCLKVINKAATALPAHRTRPLQTLVPV